MLKKQFYDSFETLKMENNMKNLHSSWAKIKIIVQLNSELKSSMKLRTKKFHFTFK